MVSPDSASDLFHEVRSLRRSAKGISPRNATRMRNIFRGPALCASGTKEDATMRTMIFGLLSVAAVVVAAPAWSQDVYVGSRGVGVDVGPRHDGDWRYRHRYGEARGECRVIRERIETPSGRVIIKTRREC